MKPTITITTPSRSPESIRFLAQVHQAVEDALLNGSVNVVLIATAMNLSEQSFRRRLRKHAAQTPKAFISAIQMQKAMSLLARSPELPVGRVAHLCGFENLGTFCHKFKHLYGCAPTAFRDKATHPHP